MTSPLQFPPPPSIQAQIDAFLTDADQTEWFKRRVNENIVAMIREGFVTYLPGPTGRRLRLTEKGRETFDRGPRAPNSSLNSIQPQE